MSHDLPPHEPAPAQRDDGGWYGTSTPARSRRSLSTVAVAIGAALALGAAALVLGAGGEWPASARRHDAASDAADRSPSAAPTTTKPLLTGPDVAPTTTGTATTIPGGPTTTEKDIIANPDEGETDAGVTYVLIADDTGQIGVEVPNTWVEVDGRPLTGVNGEVVPNVQASTDLENFRNTFESPGVSFTQLTNPIDPNDGLNYLTASNGSARGCVEQLREPYDDGVFVGLYAIFDGCGGVNSRFVQIVANGQNGHGFEISVQLLADDSFEIANHIAQTFNYAEDPNATTVPGPATTVAPGPATTVAPGPATTGAPSPATTGAPGPATTVPGPATTASGASLVPVTDDSGTLTIQVPATWVDRDTSPIVLDDGTPINAVSASTDLQAFHNGYTVSGIDATGLGNVDTAQAVPILAGSAISADCTADAAGVTPVQSPTWTGSQQIYTACTGGGSVYVVAVNRVDDPNRGVQMIIIVGPTDPTSIADQIIAGVLGS